MWDPRALVHEYGGVQMQLCLKQGLETSGLFLEALQWWAIMCWDEGYGKYSK